MILEPNLYNSSTFSTKSRKARGRTSKADCQSEPGDDLQMLATKTFHGIDRFSPPQKSYIGLCQLIMRLLHEKIKQHLKRLTSIYSSSKKCQFRFPLTTFKQLHCLFSGENIRHEAAAENQGLYPLQVLVQPVSLRFKYHFEGTRQTNRLDKVDCLMTCSLIFN
jgi:hypothetical protein